MNDDTTQRQRPAGRTFRVSVVGDTADEIELAALDAARAFFGDSRQIEVVHDYVVLSISTLGHANPLRAAGKKYCAEVPVRTVEP